MGRLINVSALVALLGMPGVLHAGSEGVQAEPRSPSWIQLSPHVTTLFRWNGDRLAAFDSATGQVFALPGSGATETRLELLVDLQLPASKASGTIYPDPLLRAADGRLFLLSKGGRTIFEFDAEGKLVDRIEVPFPATHHLSMTSEGSLLVVGHCLDRPCAGSSVWSDGIGWGEVRSAWLEPGDVDSNAVAAAFLFPGQAQGDASVELPHYFPWLKIAGTASQTAMSYLDCPDMPDFVRRTISEQTARHGLPKPLGGGFHGGGLPYPVLLAADRYGDSVYGVVNGRLALHVTIDGPAIRCVPLPAPPASCSSGVVKAVAANSSSVAYLYGCQGSGENWAAIINR